MAHNTVTASWALNTTSDNVFAVAQGVLKAATSDNVQPLALLTAEAFGGTLAICQQTLLKVERQARKNQHSVIKFLQAQVGYFANDSASHLSSSSNGVRFLSLVAMLLCSSSSFEAAKALDMMIQSTSSPGQMLPTLTQLQDLIEALEPKLMHTDFADEICGWRNFLVVSLEAHNILITEQVRYDTCPGSKMIRDLVDAFRTSMRLGVTVKDEIVMENSTLVVTACAHLPWIISFVKWCSGMPPHIVLGDGTSILRQPGSRVTLRVIEDDVDNWLSAFHPTRLRIEFFEAINTPSQLWEVVDCIGHRWAALVSVSNFAVERLFALNAKVNVTVETVALAVSYAIPLIVKHLRPWTGTANEKEMHPTLPIFPPMRQILQVYREYFSALSGSSNTDLNFKEMAEYTSLRMLPEIAISIEHIRDSCQCDGCRPNFQGTGRVLVCRVRKFEESVLAMCADILALSLLEPTSSIKLCVRSQVERRPRFYRLIQDLIFGTDIEPNMDANGLERCSVIDIVEWALFLMGVNDNQLHHSGWVASASKGQVIFWSFFENPKLDFQGLNRLGIVHGTLRYKNCQYKEVRSGNGLQYPNTICHPEPVDRLRNLMGRSSIVWQVAADEANTLLLSCGFSDLEGCRHPSRMLWAASGSLFASSCEHPPDSQLETADENAYFITPCYNHSLESEEDGTPETPGAASTVMVVPSAGNAEHRFLALAGREPAVIRGDACLGCCLRICREARYKCVIL